MLTNASHAAGTVCIVNAFGTAAGRIRVADVRRNARTLCNTILNDALWIFATWWRIAWIEWDDRDVGNSWATDKCVAAIACHAITVCRVRDHVALGVRATRILAWIFTAFSNACLVLWAIVAQDTLWSTVWWAADVIFDARADRATLCYLTNRIRTARRWWARIFRLAFNANGRSQCAWHERIASFAWLAATNWIVIDDFAACISATHSWTWVDAFQVDACFGERAFRVGNTFRLADWWRSAIAGHAWAYCVARWW